MTPESNFLDKFYQYAEAVKGSKLTIDERMSLKAAFDIETGSLADRAEKAVQKVISKKVEGLAKSANLNNIMRLLTDLRASASAWKPKK